MTANSPFRGARAFSLVEIVIALGIMSFALLSLVGLASIGMQRSGDSRKLQEAASVANRILQMRRSAPEANASGTLFDPATFPLPPFTSSVSQTNYLTATGALTASATSDDATYGLAVTITAPDPAQRAIVTSKVSLEIFWPPTASNPQSYRLVTEVLTP
mgnify:CR=1 FL=1|jgi:uncharacterized protein (TIGR02598 family)